MSPDGTRWISCRRGYFLPVEVLSCLFRRLFIEALQKAYAAGQLQFFSALAQLKEKSAFQRYLAPLRQTDCRVGGDVAIPTPHRPGRAGLSGSSAIAGFCPHRSHRAALPQWALQKGPEAGRSLCHA